MVPATAFTRHLLDMYKGREVAEHPLPEDDEPNLPEDELLKPRVKKHIPDFEAHLHKLRQQEGLVWLRRGRRPGRTADQADGWL